MRLAPLLLALLAGCSTQTSTTGSTDNRALLGAPDGPPVAVVNGETISEPLLVAYARSAGLDPSVAEQRQRALDGLVDNVLLTQFAFSEAGASSAEIAAEATLARLAVVANRVVASESSRLQADESQIAALYERERQRAGDTEWRAQHILFADKPAAEAALARAQAPDADFDALVAEYAAGGAKQARDLPWANATQLPESLVEALRQLEDGAVAPLVLESSFGFHVLRRVESRPFSPPSLEDVREGARRQLIEQGLKDYVAGLRAKAQIDTGAKPPAN